MDILINFSIFQHTQKLIAKIYIYKSPYGGNKKAVKKELYLYILENRKRNLCDKI